MHSNQLVIGNERKYLEIAAQYGLDTLDITSHIVEQFLDSFEEPRASSETEMQHFDQSTITQLRWLSYDLNQSFEIIVQSNRLIRRFICMICYSLKHLLCF